MSISIEMRYGIEPDWDWENNSCNSEEEWWETELTFSDTEEEVEIGNKFRQLDLEESSNYNCQVIKRKPTLFITCQFIRKAVMIIFEVTDHGIEVVEHKILHLPKYGNKINW
jgi:hypothetical protein